MTDGAQLGGISPFFLVSDVSRAVHFYRERLGFELRFAEPADAPFFAIVGRDDTQIFLKFVSESVGPQPNPTRHEWAAWDAFVFVADPDALAAELVTRGAPFRRELGNRDDGLRGFEIADADGYVLFFGRPVEGGPTNRESPEPGAARVVKARMRSSRLFALLALSACTPEPNAGLRSESYELVGEQTYELEEGLAPVQRQAALDFQCPAQDVSVTMTQKRELIVDGERKSIEGLAFKVSGCKHGGMYVPVRLYGTTSSLGLMTIIELRAFVPVWNEAVSSAALRHLDAKAEAFGLIPREGYQTSSPRVTDTDRQTVQQWVDFTKAAARDLACPREEVALQILENRIGVHRGPSTFIAEGCGLRGLFTWNGNGELVITSKVELPK